MQLFFNSNLYTRFFREILRTAILVLFLFQWTQSNAQIDESLWHPVYEQFTVKDGLPGMEFYYSFQDRDGYMWFASDRGVVRYNGDKFETFTTDDGLVSNTVFKIDQDDKGRIWFLTDVPRLCYFENDQIVQYKFNAVFQSCFPVGSVIRSYTAWNFDNGRVLLSTNMNGTVKIDKNGILRTESRERLKNVEVTSKEVFFEEGLILNETSISDTIGKDRFVAISFNKTKEIVLPRMIFDLMKTGWIEKDCFFIAGTNELYLSTPDKDSLYRFEKLIYSCAVIEGKLWLSLQGGGVEIFNINGEKITKNNHFFKDRHVTNVFKTREGHYWFSTLYNGLYLIRSMDITEMDKEVYSTAPFLFLAKRKENLYFFDESKTFSSINLRTGKEQADSFGFQSMYLTPMSDVHSDEIFVRSEVVKRKNVTGEQNFLFSTPFRQDVSLNDFDKDVYYPGFGVIKRGQSDYVFWTSRSIYLKNANLEIPISSQVLSMELEDINALWFSQPSQVKILNLSTNEISSSKYKLLQQRVNSIHKSNGILFFGTHGNGVITKKGDKVQQLSIQNGTVRKYVNKIVSKENGPVWLMGSSGVSKLVYTDGIGYQTNEFDLRDLKCQKVNDIYPDDDYLYLATNSGIRRIKGSQTIAKNSIPRLHLTSVEIKDSIIKESTFTLEYNQKDLVIYYDAVSYEGKPVVFRYRMNKEDDWILIEERSIRFNALDNGSYSFEIQASIDGRNWSKSEILDFEILPPYWKTWWFITLVIISGIGIIILLVNLRLRIVNRRHGEKATLMELNQKMLELRQEALTQQMNPHFIFNALGSVQNSILKGDSIQANKYLVKFSKLLRAGLNASRSQLVPLEEDMELMENYLAVEKTRLGESFTFDFEIALKSDEYSLYISPFLLQPFIENAIKHGLDEDHPSGKVSVSYVEEESCIRCTITDNGQGRQAAKKLRISGHTSHGSEIAFSRIELFNKSQGAIGEHRTEDLYDAEGNPCGTKVVFTVPILRKD